MKPKSIRLFSRAAMLLLMLLLTVTTTWADNVATVTANGNTITYSSLESAVSAATYAYNTYGTAATITLLEDITEQSCSLEVRKPMIVDLNGHVVNATNLAYGYGIFSIYNADGQVIIKNGTISRRGESSYNGYAIYNYNGNLELENVTVKNTYSTANPCIYINSTCSLTVSKGITFVGSINNSGTVRIASGQTLYDKNGIEYSGYISSSQVANLANNTLSSLVTVTANGATTHYNSLESAVSAATYAYNTYGTAATITLYQDITEQSCSLEVRKPMIVDLNGHVVNATNLAYGYGIFSIYNADGQVIIKNGTISRRGESSYNGYAIYNYNGNLELENVTVKNTYSTANPCIYINSTCSLTVSKGITFVGSINNSGTVRIASGQTLYDKNGIEYSGYISSSQVANLANNTLSSLVTVTANGATTHYNSLESAVSAATYAYNTYGTAATITLYQDITEQSCSLEVRKPMIINLNGHVVNATNLAYGYGIFSIYNADGQVIIKNGTISRRGESSYNGYAIYNYNGNLELENVTVKNTYSTANPCIYINSTCSLTVSKGITFVGSINNSGTVRIASGQTLYDKNGIEYSGYISSSQVANLANNTLSSLVTVTANGATNHYSSLLDAVSAATDAYNTYGTSATIKLYHNITAQPCTLMVTKPMIIDLNNHRINTTAYYSLFYIYLSNGQQMTIKNGSIRGREYDVYINKGEAVLENITAEDPSYGSNCVYICSTCTLTVSKGITFGASIYNQGFVKTASGQSFHNGTEVLRSGSITDMNKLNGKTLINVDVLRDNAANDVAALATRLGGKQTNIALDGRTLYKDGYWNTLVLPFAVSNFTGTPLEGAIVKELLTTSSLSGDELTLNFSDNLTAIQAGKPYIVKWESGSNIVNPVFTNVTVSSTTNNTAFTGGSFKGTYAPINWTEETPSILFVGENNQLHWPLAGAHLNACRAYFELDDPNANVREFNLNFGEETSDIVSIDNSQFTIHNEAGAWYTVNGVKLSGKPTKKGMYIYNGKKVVIK